ncbi:3 beta-hydroxysteroid dehydrogenase/Delta 5--_4-isomerase type 4-like [Amphiura filiformis]|uniref:3 beta-hydroxysteroid dehydrogenase/Delta 5-->4-isomerase type 4-like n=1 Tax=Amphiura filiformis TaxID=82378 RepID=UPI003B20CFA8
MAKGSNVTTLRQAWEIAFTEKVCVREIPGLKNHSASKSLSGLEPVAYNNNSKAKLKSIKGDICELGQLSEACRDATAIIHSAAFIDVSSLQDEKKLHMVNVIGTDNVILSCFDNNIERLVFTSTVDAYLPPTPFPTANVTELEAQTPSNFLMGSYGATKNKAEWLVMQHNRSPLQNGNLLRTCALRIGCMYGEGDEITRNLMELPAKSKKNYPIGHDDHVIQKIYAGNAAWAHVLAVHKLKDSSVFSPAGKSMFIEDDTPLKSLSAHFQPYVDGLGAVNSFRISFRLIYAVAAMMDFLSWLLQPIYSIRSNITRSSILFCKNNYTMRSILARRCLGYKPLYTYDEGIARSIVYLKAALNVQ